jgi:mRNA-degrading endonuclease HigB of HigAB toxin-antitoxin module
VGNSSWKKVTNVPQLTKYALYEQSQPRIFQYTLRVYLTNTEFGETYTFEDQEGNDYTLTVFLDGQHVDFDSEKPNIQRVRTHQEF